MRVRRAFLAGLIAAALLGAYAIATAYGPGAGGPTETAAFGH